MGNISIIITTFDRTKHLFNLLWNIYEFQQFDGDVDIVVVDDGSTDNLLEQLRNKYSGKNIQYIWLNRRYDMNRPKTKFSPALPRNIGLKFAKYGIVGIFDPEHMFMHRDYLSKVIELPKGYYHRPHLIRLDYNIQPEALKFFENNWMHIKDCENYAINYAKNKEWTGGHVCYNLTKQKDYEYIQVRGKFKTKKEPELPPGCRFALSIGGFDFLHKSDIISLGGYNTNIKIGSGSDVELLYRCINADFKFYFNNCWMIHFPHWYDGHTYDSDLQNFDLHYLDSAKTRIEFTAPVDEKDFVVII